MTTLLRLLLGCLLLGGAAASAQPPDTLWTHTYGGPDVDDATTICQTADGSFIVAGYTHSGAATPYDVFVAKLDGLGDTVWTRRYGGPSNHDMAYAVAATPDNGCVIAGATQSFGAGLFDWYVLRLNAAGDTLWTRTFGNSYNDEARAVALTADGGYLVAGYGIVSASSNGNVQVMRLDASGNLLWNRHFGGNQWDAANSVAALPNGCILAGATLSAGAGLRDMYVLRLNASGDSLWTRTYGGSGIDEALAAIPCEGGGFLVGGWTRSFGAQMDDMYLVRTGETGDTLWTRRYGSARSDKLSALVQASDGGYLIGGSTDSLVSRTSDFYFLKLTPAGEVVWTRRDGGPNNEYLNDLAITGDGGFIAAGSTLSYGHGLRDAWVVRSPGYSGITGTVREVLTGAPVAGAVIAAAGEAARTISDALGFYTLTLVPGHHTIVTGGRCISVDTVLADVEVFLDSLLHEDITVGVPRAEVTQTSVNVVAHNGTLGTDTLWLYNTGSGPLHYTVTWQGVAPSEPWFSPVPSTGDVAAGDSFGVAVRFVPDTTNNGAFDYFGYLDVHMNSCPDSLKRVVVVGTSLDADVRLIELPAEFDLACYPNPFNAQATLLYAVPQPGRVRLTVFDITGREVTTLVDGPAPAGLHRVLWDARAAASGLYFARLETNGQSLSRKLLLVK